uniref:Uncharacterized protein n=1 Tax=Rangifer tarandus platyrhynchus TaxID=3082113 RepID=A0ACB0EDM8_RANTA|nr:unnamed protein product [Rangifer tarandus platyrhynchus]
MRGRAPGKAHTASGGEDQRAAAGDPGGALLRELSPGRALGAREARETGTRPSHLRLSLRLALLCILCHSEAGIISACRGSRPGCPPTGPTGAFLPPNPWTVQGTLGTPSSRPQPGAGSPGLRSPVPPLPVRMPATRQSHPGHRPRPLAALGLSQAVLASPAGLPREMASARAHGCHSLLLLFSSHQRRKGHLHPEMPARLTAALGGQSPRFPPGWGASPRGARRETVQAIQTEELASGHRRLCSEVSGVCSSQAPPPSSHPEDDSLRGIVLRNRRGSVAAAVEASRPDKQRPRPEA